MKILAKLIQLLPLRIATLEAQQSDLESDTLVEMA